jgi:hypothetical protein
MNRRQKAVGRGQGCLGPECNSGRTTASKFTTHARDPYRSLIYVETGKAGGTNMAKLTTAKRKDLPKGDFAIPETRRYPIEDAAHARDALARSSGKSEHKTVAAAVRRKYPKIDVKS